MGKAGKKRKHDEKMKKKRAAKKAKYLALAGTSKGRKRLAPKRRTAGPNRGNHVMANCGNPGCRRYFPQFIPVRPKKKVPA
jgi:hypothetical protein